MYNTRVINGFAVLYIQEIMQNMHRQTTNLETKRCNTFLVFKDPSEVILLPAICLT